MLKLTGYSCGHTDGASLIDSKELGTNTGTQWSIKGNHLMPSRGPLKEVHDSVTELNGSCDENDRGRPCCMHVDTFTQAGLVGSS